MDNTNLHNCYKNSSSSHGSFKKHLYQDLYVASDLSLRLTWNAPFQCNWSRDEICWEKFNSLLQLFIKHNYNWQVDLFGWSSMTVKFQCKCKTHSSSSHATKGLGSQVWVPGFNCKVDLQKERIWTDIHRQLLITVYKHMSS